MRLFAKLAVLCCCAIAIMSPAMATNLIVDGGFEGLGFGYFVEAQGNYAGFIPDVLYGQAAYQYQYVVTSGVPQGWYGAAANETLAGTYIDQPPVYHSGNQALRVYIYAGPDHTPANPPGIATPAANIMVMQDVLVTGGLDYSASAWVRTHSTGNYTGVGDLFGNGLDKAGIKIIELDSTGGTLATHTSYLTDANSAYRQVAVGFTANAATTKIRFTLDSYLSTELDGGYFCYDDLSLQAVPEPGSLAVLFSGIVGFAGLALRRRS